MTTTAQALVQEVLVHMAWDEAEVAEIDTEGLLEEVVAATGTVEEVAEIGMEAEEETEVEETESATAHVVPIGVAAATVGVATS